jgi:hypothetical protein
MKLLDKYTLINNVIKAGLAEFDPSRYKLSIYSPYGSKKHGHSHSIENYYLNNNVLADCEYCHIRGIFPNTDPKYLICVYVLDTYSRVGSGYSRNLKIDTLPEICFRAIYNHPSNKQIPGDKLKAKKVRELISLFSV